jgi:hypothetical protein
VWILGHQGLATATAGKLKSLSDAGNSPFANFFELAVLLMGAVGPALLVFGIASWRRAGMSASASSLLKRLVGRQFLIAGALLVICILVFRITEFRARWFLPLIIGAPLLLVAWAWPRLNESRIRALTILGMAILAAVAALLPGRILFAEKLGRIEPLHRPFAELAGPIASRVAEGGVVLAESRLIGGNLRLAGLKSPVVSPDTWNVIPHPQGPVLLVWDATAQPQPSERFIRNLAKLGLQLGSPPESFEAVCLHHSSRTYRLAISLATPSPPSE